MVGQNNFTRSLYYNEVLTISYNVLNSILKVKNGVVISVLVIYPHDLMADLQLWLTAPVQHHQSITLDIAWEKIQIQNVKYGFC